jgi:hypothetical protein
LNPAMTDAIALPPREIGEGFLSPILQRFLIVA